MTITIALQWILATSPQHLCSPMTAQLKQPTLSLVRTLHSHFQNILCFFLFNESNACFSWTGKPPNLQKTKKKAPLFALLQLSHSDQSFRAVWSHTKAGVNQKPPSGAWWYAPLAHLKRESVLNWSQPHCACRLEDVILSMREIHWSKSWFSKCTK